MPRGQETGILVRLVRVLVQPDALAHSGAHSGAHSSSHSSSNAGPEHGNAEHGGPEHGDAQHGHTKVIVAGPL
jgi:hypothetical protein